MALETVAAALVGIGYQCLGEAGVPGRVYLRRRDDEAFNASVTRLNSKVWANNIALREYLRAGESARRRYAEVKYAAVAAGHVMLLDYGDAKARILDQLLAEAMQWRSGR